MTTKKKTSTAVAVQKVNTPEPMGRVQATQADVTLSLRARCSGFWITTRDEARTDQELVPAISKAGYVTWFWDIANGITGVDGKPLRNADYNSPEGPDEVLALIEQKSKQRVNYDIRETDADRNVWVLHDIAPWLEGVGGAVTRRKLQNLLRPDGLSGTARQVAQAIILVSNGATIPSELNNGELTVIDWPLPDRTDIGVMLDRAVEVLPDTMREQVQLSLQNGSRDAAIDAAVGLSSQEIQTTFARSLIESSNIDPKAIAAEKKRIISKEPAMEYYEPRPGGFANVGGLENWKEWAIKQLISFGPEARAYNLDPAKAVMLLGMSGCGKTLSCQALGSEWGWPVVRLDINALKGKYVGESEARLRAMFGTINALGQVIVYIDEVEKALEGAVSGSADGGVSADALGAILTWMQDRTSPAFVIMTANDPSKLPPEFLRKGRFDEIWWIDLPTTAERIAIVEATLRGKGRDPHALDLDMQAIAEATEGFTGAEIAAVIKRDAMFTAFLDGQREIVTNDVLMGAKDVIPLARTSAEKIARLRETWAGRARPATRPEAGQQSAFRGGVRQIDL